MTTNGRERDVVDVVFFVCSNGNEMICVGSGLSRATMTTWGYARGWDVKRNDARKTDGCVRA